MKKRKKEEREIMFFSMANKNSADNMMAEFELQISCSAVSIAQHSVLTGPPYIETFNPKED